VGGKGREVKFAWKDPVHWIVLEVEEVGGLVSPYFVHVTYGDLQT